MKPIGGFFGLELTAGGTPPHPRAAAVNNGRSCLTLMLRSLRPRRVFVPFYACDALLQPLVAERVAIERYAIDECLEPVLTREPAGDECVVYINYFGLKSATAAGVVERFGPRSIIDNSHAFFAGGSAEVWSFNSARKFFGVPDGAYAYGPGLSDATRLPDADVCVDHLVNRLAGRDDVAFAQFRAAEERMGVEPHAMSTVTKRLLAAVDLNAVAAARKRNFHTLHERLGASNRVPARVLGAESEAPFCYPLLLDREPEHDRLWQAGFFIPRLWPEVAAAQPEPAFARDVDRARRLLPLPVDHRYGDEDMTRLADGVAALLP